MAPDAGRDAPGMAEAAPPARLPAVAGAWYPADPQVLRRTIVDALDRAPQVALPGPLLALVAPHAGIAYSGGVAAHAYAQVRGGSFARVILLGPLHRPIRGPGGRHGAFMAPRESAYRTPLGDVPVDRAFIAALDSRVGLTPVHGDEEHSLEIELPFLQVALAQFSLVPIMLGQHIASPGTAAAIDLLSGALAALWREDTLLVASTDLSHLDNYADVVRIDSVLARLLDAFALDDLDAALRAEQVQACGATGLMVALRTAQQLGARGARVLAYAASGDVTGDRRPGVYTVGYMAAAAYG